MMKRLTIYGVIMMMAGLLVVSCGKKKDTPNYLEQYKKTVNADEDYEACRAHIKQVIKHVELYKKYKGKPPEDLSELKHEYNVNPVCPSDKTPYVYTSIVPKPGEEVTGESIRAFYDGPDKRTFKIYCPHHRIKEYGR